MSILNININNQILSISFTDSEYMFKAMSRFCYFHENKELPSRDSKVKRYQGYNFPSSVIFLLEKLFPRSADQSLTKEENDVKKMMTKSTKYIVGYMDGDKETKQHEELHAKYYLDLEYKKKIDGVWQNLDNDIKDEITRFLMRIGYSASVIVDEFQAYCWSGNPSKFWTKKIWKNIKDCL